ncbi:hypothetical protein HDU87_007382 [Geranomyces variabilis]|uniref:Uncharacterized protein n=1 Tax=Geranomyces variabilis TaxID=109894 RepID=A0AAD5XSR7_9FUNG|nr:hypothetical protein HDU87_007382 [Geranomyces variabilis]
MAALISALADIVGFAQNDSKSEEERQEHYEEVKVEIEEEELLAVEACDEATAAVPVQTVPATALQPSLPRGRSLSPLPSSGSDSSRFSRRSEPSSSTNLPGSSTTPQASPPRLPADVSPLLFIPTIVRRSPSPPLLNRSETPVPELQPAASQRSDTPPIVLSETLPPPPAPPTPLPHASRSSVRRKLPDSFGPFSDDKETDAMPPELLALLPRGPGPRAAYPNWHHPCDLPDRSDPYRKLAKRQRAMVRMKMGGSSSHHHRSGPVAGAPAADLSDVITMQDLLTPCPQSARTVSDVTELTFNPAWPSRKPA